MPPPPLPPLEELLELDAPARRAVERALGPMGELRHSSRVLRHLLVVALSRIDTLEERCAELELRGSAFVVPLQGAKRAQDMVIGGRP
jgi:hypothetical protein